MGQTDRQTERIKDRESKMCLDLLFSKFYIIEKRKSLGFKLMLFLHFIT